MGDSVEDYTDCSEIFTQDGVLLKQAPACYMSHINVIGTLYVTESPNSSRQRFIEWKPNEITIEPEIQDQEWALVNTIQKRSRTLSGNFQPDYHSRPKCIKFSFNGIKSFRVANKSRQLTFYDGKSESMCSFLFNNGNCDTVVNLIKTMLKTGPSRRDKHLFVVYDTNNLELQRLDRSFAELNLHHDGRTFWNMVKNIRDHPYEATFEAFAKVTDYGKYAWNSFYVPYFLVLFYLGRYKCVSRLQSINSGYLCFLCQGKLSQNRFSIVYSLIKTYVGVVDRR